MSVLCHSIPPSASASDLESPIAAALFAAPAVLASDVPDRSLAALLSAACRLVLRWQQPGDPAAAELQSSAAAPTLPPLSGSDDFFAIGGDSLSAAQLVALLNQHAQRSSAQPAAAASSLADQGAQSSLLSLSDLYECPSLDSLLQRWTQRIHSRHGAHTEAVAAESNNRNLLELQSIPSNKQQPFPAADRTFDVTGIASSSNGHGAGADVAGAAAASSLMAELFGGSFAASNEHDKVSAACTVQQKDGAESAISLADQAEAESAVLLAITTRPRPQGLVDDAEADAGELSYSQQRIWLAEQLHGASAAAAAASTARNSRSRSSSVTSVPASPTLRSSSPVLNSLSSSRRSASPVGSASSASPALRFTAYHISRLFVLTGALDMSALLLALRALIARHGQLRTGFALDPVTQQPRQYTVDAHSETINVDAQISQLPRFAKGATTAQGANASSPSQVASSGCPSPRALSEAEALRSWAAALDQRPFDLSTAPLVRVHLTPLSPTSAGVARRALFLMFHHLTLDGWSMGVVMHELGAMYRAIVESKRKAAVASPVAEGAIVHPSPITETADVELAAHLPALPRWSYLDFAAWHRRLCDPARRHRSAPISEQLRFWCQELKGYEALQLPLDFARSTSTSGGAADFAGDVVHVHLPSALLRSMHALCRRLRVSLFSLLLSSAQLLLSKVTSQADVLVGTAAAGRHYPGSEHVVGCFINMLACRARFEQPESTSGEQMIKETHARMMRALENQDAPIELVAAAVQAQEQQLQAQDGLAPTGSDPVSPLFDVLVVLQNQSSRRGGLLNFGPELTSELVDHPTQTSKVKLAIVAEEVRSGGGGDSKQSEGGLSVRFEFNTSALLRASVAALSQHWRCLAEQLVSAPLSSLSSYSLLSAADRSMLVRDFNERHARPEWLQSDTLIHLLIEQQCQRTPELTAVQMGDDCLTYKQLDEQSSQACNLMRNVAKQYAATHVDSHSEIAFPLSAAAVTPSSSSLGPVPCSPSDCPIVPDDVIAICLPSSLELFVLIVGVMKLGAAYVPLDPAYPPERLQFMLRDSGAKMLITTSALLETLTSAATNDGEGNGSGSGSMLASIPASPNGCTDALGLNIPVLLLDSCWPSLLLQSPRYLPSSVCRTNLSYVIYTSGSTGRPKGVMVEHWTHCNMARYFFLDLTVGKRLLQFASQSFDAAVSEWSCAFVVGACLCLTRGNNEKVGQGLVDTIARYSINIAMVSPSVLASITPCPLPSLDYLVVAGEANTEQVLEAWRPLVKLRNAYGPTEITVCSNTFTYDGAHPASCIGFPQPNYTCYVLDAARQLVPVGVAGELYIGGVGVARGYLNQSELTEERFLPDPFAAADSTYKRMYRSGDIVRWLPDGTLLYHGRNDAQVKIRGVRVELGEIEHNLCAHPRVGRAVVMAKEMGASGKQLVAFVVVKSAARTMSISSDAESSELVRSSSVVSAGSADTAQDSPTTTSAASSPRPVLAHSFALRSIQKHMQRTVPAHLRPAYYVFLPSLPINRSAKTDLQALAKLRVGPEHMASRRQERHVSLDTSTPSGAGSCPPPFSLRSPTSTLQSRLSPTPPPAHTPSSSHRRRTATFIQQLGAVRAQLVAAWCRVLDRSDVDGSENFFEAGGHSILAAQLHASLAPEIKQHVTLLHIFMYPTINSLCAFLMQSRSNAQAAAEDGTGGVTPLAGGAGVSSQILSRANSRRMSLTPQGISGMQLLLDSSAGQGTLASSACVGSALESALQSPPQAHHSLASTRVSSALSFTSDRDSVSADPVQLASEECSGVVSEAPSAADEPIAIIGMGGRFPGANSVAQLWGNLCAGTESIKFYSREELAAAGVPDAQLSQSSYVRAMGALDDVFGFDAAFFRMSAREAQSMDPQHRIFLETAWQALEDAGYCPNPAMDQQQQTERDHAGPQGDSDSSCLPQPRVGVFAGCGVNTYLTDYCAVEFSHLSPVDRHALLTANEKDFLASRVSYKLNLNGPALVVQTACSTSLVAIHTACESLRRGECDLALAGGVSLGQLRPMGYQYEPGMILSPDGHCRAFDAEACGTVRGQGAGAVVLKRLSAAQADGDLIYAVVRGSAINNDGSHKVSYSAPSASGQTAVIRAALEAANVHPRSIGFVEAHGTGTQLGDLIEVAALTKAYRCYTADTAFAALGSIKTNIGHLDAAAGVTGFIKAALALHHALIPGTMHFRAPAPQLRLEQSPFLVRAGNIPFPHDVTAGQCRSVLGHRSIGDEVQDASVPADTLDREEHVTTEPNSPAAEDLCPARAAVSSFGIGGTNAHAILEAAPTGACLVEDDAARVYGSDANASSTEAPVPTPVLLCWSAVSQVACRSYARNLADWLRANPAASLHSVAYTLQMHRAHFDVRKTIMATTVAEAIEKLDAAAAEGTSLSTSGSPLSLYCDAAGHALSTPPPPSIVFLFPGQGSHFSGMGLDLYASEPAFRAQVDECLAILRSILPSQFGAITAEQLFAGDQMEQTQFAQPALFILEYSLAQLLRRWGLQPAALIGHSLGQYVAACVAGVFSLADGLRLVVARSQLLHELVPAGVGCMLSVRLGEEELERRFPRADWPDVAVAACNSHMHVTLSGPVAAVRGLQAAMAQQGVACTLLSTSHAFHSPMLAPMLGTFEKALQQVALQPAEIPMLCNVTGGWASHESMQTPAYWIEQMRNKVCFKQGLQTLLSAASLGPSAVDASSSTHAPAAQLHEPLFIEVGPGDSCLALLKRQAAWLAAQTKLAQPEAAPPASFALDRCVALLPKPRTGHGANAASSPAVQLPGTLETVLQLTANAWERGVKVDWAQMYATRPSRVRLPTYPFQRVRHVMSGSLMSPARLLSLTSNGAQAPNSPAQWKPAANAGSISPEAADLLSPLAAPAVGAGMEQQVEHFCLLLFHALLGVPLAALTPASDFFSLGGDSLSAIQLLAELRKRFCIPLPGSLVMSFPTPAKIAQQVAAIHASTMQQGSGSGVDSDGIDTAKMDGGVCLSSADHKPAGQLLSPGLSQLQPININSAPSMQLSSPRDVRSPFSALSPMCSPAAVAHLLHSSLTPIQSGMEGDGPPLTPLFMVAPIGGELYYYRDLAPMLGPRRPVYGFRAVSLDGSRPPFDDVRSMAAAYVDELIEFLTEQTQQRLSMYACASPTASPAASLASPSSASSLSSASPPVSSVDLGPILLGGVSFGGTVAYEMATVLASRGHSVPLLVLVDSPAPGGLPERLGDEQGVREYIAGRHTGAMADQIRSSKSDGEPSLTASGAASSSLITPSLIATWLAHERALFSYTPSSSADLPPFKGRAIFFRPTSPMKHTPLHMHLPWLDLLPAGLILHRVPGDHLSMNSKQLMAHWGRLLKAEMEQL